jgi:hypothetical protein
MATSDGESCSAEERALKDWEDLPWEEGDFWEPLEAARLNIIRCYKEAFRAGFRAGQKSGAEYLELVKRVETCEDRLCWVESCEDRLCCIEKAPYIDDRIIEHEKRIEALEAWRKFSAIELVKRIEALEAWRRFSAKLDDIEAKRLLEPIG